MSEVQGWLIYAFVWTLLFCLFMCVVKGMRKIMRPVSKEQSND